VGFRRTPGVSGSVRPCCPTTPVKPGDGCNGPGTGSPKETFGEHIPTTGLGTRAKPVPSPLIDRIGEPGRGPELAVGFQEVVHLVRTEEAEVAKLQCSTERPDERQFNITPKTVAKWVERFRAGGVDGLRDRSSRPLSLPSPNSACDMRGR
jgi:hypothetical protein